MLRGASELHLDTKGRLAIPSRYREELMARCDGQMVVTLNSTAEKCLWMYPMDAWQQAERKVAGLPDMVLEHRTLKRFFLGHASDVEMDKNGRVLLPAPLRKRSGMEKEIYMIGQGNKFELWSGEHWDEQHEQWLQADLAAGKTSVEMGQLSL